MELIRFKKEGKTWVRCACDECGHEYEGQLIKENYRKKGVIANGREVCAECVSRESKKRLVEAGIKALKAMSPEKRRQVSSDAGKIGSKHPNAIASRFSSKRWRDMSEKEQKQQVRRASDALQKKLQDPKCRQEHCDYSPE